MERATLWVIATLAAFMAVHGHTATAAPTPEGTTIDGAVAHPGPVDAATLAHLPQQNLPVVYGTGHGVRDGRYAGVMLWDLLLHAGPQDETGKHARLRHTVMVSGRDGYAVAFSFGELDPGGSADPVLLVPGGATIDLLVPGDRTGARDVHDVAHITVR